MKDFFSTKKFKLLVGLAVVLAGVMAWAGANGRLTSVPQELLGAIVTPVQNLARLASGGWSDLMDKYIRIDSIVEENQQLKEQNRLLQEQLVGYDKLKMEYESLQTLNNISEENPGYEYLWGEVIGRDPLEQFGSFTLNLGTSKGVAQGDVVVDDMGYLVGRVLEASLTSSKVMTILQPGSYVACMVSRTRDSGNLGGESSYSIQGQCVLENLSRDTLAIVGDQVITTGLGGEFPPNIRVGTVQELVPEESGKSTIAVVQPGADINSIKRVYVITNYE